jgi:hypothetical protein
MKRNSTDYCLAIKQQYKKAKTEIYEGFLLEPSPANLRDFCLLLLENGLDKIDFQIFFNFFQPNTNQDLKKAIQHFDVEKFKTICNFLKGISQNTNSNNLNLIAVLVNFQPRPLSKFIISDSERIVRKNEDELIDSIIIEDKVVRIKKGYRNIIVIGIVSVISVFGFQKLNYNSDKCMQWQENKYVIINCESENLYAVSSLPILALDKNIVNLKKINPYDFKPYFKYGNPTLWYHKMNGELEYFNCEGKHPVTGKQLKPITPYIVDKYLQGK